MNGDVEGAFKTEYRAVLPGCRQRVPESGARRLPNGRSAQWPGPSRARRAKRRRQAGSTDSRMPWWAAPLSAAGDPRVSGRGGGASRLGARSRTVGDWVGEPAARMRLPGRASARVHSHGSLLGAPGPGSDWAHSSRAIANPSSSRRRGGLHPRTSPNDLGESACGELSVRAQWVRHSRHFDLGGMVGRGRSAGGEDLARSGRPAQTRTLRHGGSKRQHGLWRPPCHGRGSARIARSGAEQNSDSRLRRCLQLRPSIRRGQDLDGDRRDSMSGATCRRHARSGACGRSSSAHGHMPRGILVSRIGRAEERSRIATPVDGTRDRRPHPPIPKTAPRVLTARTRAVAGVSRDGS